MKFYVSCNWAGAVFVKDAKFFEEQGGLTSVWGKQWRPLEASSLDVAVVLAKQLFSQLVNPEEEVMTMRKTYSYHAPSPESLVRITKLREAFSTLHGIIEDATPPSRERSVSLTDLETAAMWAIKAVVINDPESKPS